MDEQLRYIMQNAASRQMFGEVIGQRLEDSPVSEETKAKFRELDRRVLAGEVLHDQYEVDVRPGPDTTKASSHR